MSAADEHLKETHAVYVQTKVANWERIILGGLQALMIAAVLWMVNTVNDSSIEIAAMSVKIETLQENVAELKDAAGDRYTATMAERDKAAMEAQMSELRARIRELERLQ